MSNKVNIFIGKKSSGSVLTDGNINYLKGKIILLNNVYNIIFKHLCHKKNVDRSWDVLAHVKADLLTQVPNHLNDFCLGAVNTGPITPTAIEVTRDLLIKADLATGKEEDAINAAKFYLVQIKLDKSYSKRPSEITGSFQS